MPRLPLRHSLSAACAALVAGAGLMAVTPAMATTQYLGWASKPATPPAPATEPAPQRQPAQPAQQPQGRYGVPASPYGQVGYPFRTLAWSNKPGEDRAPVPVQTQVQTQVQAPVQPISNRVPAPQMQAPQMPAPAMRAAASAPPPPEQPRTITQNGHTYVLPRAPKGAIEPEDDPVYDDVVSADAPPPAPPHAAPRPAPPHTAPQAMRPSVQPDPAPVARIAAAPETPVAPAPAAPARIAPAQPADDGAYQVPASSKYAARIAAARAAAADSQSSQPSPPAPLPAEGSAQPAAAMATAPATAEPLAAQETDHVFIPGEQIRSAADEPRFYSLHRQYGYKPDPITVDHNATGAILDPGYDIQTADDSDSDSHSKDGDAPAGDDPK